MYIKSGYTFNRYDRKRLSPSTIRHKLNLLTAVSKDKPMYAAHILFELSRATFRCVVKALDETYLYAKSFIFKMFKSENESGLLPPLKPIVPKVIKIISLRISTEISNNEAELNTDEESIDSEPMQVENAEVNSQLTEWDECKIRFPTSYHLYANMYDNRGNFVGSPPSFEDYEEPEYEGDFDPDYQYYNYFGSISNVSETTSNFKSRKRKHEE